MLFLAFKNSIYIDFFFFQAEDGIRDESVTGVQTCALPISGVAARPRPVGDACGERRRSGRAREDRKSVVEGKSVDLGGRRFIKKKKPKKRKAIKGGAGGGRVTVGDASQRSHK